MRRSRCASLEPCVESQCGSESEVKGSYLGCRCCSAAVWLTSCRDAGASSRALLHILASLRNQNSARKVRGLTRFQLSAIYVDESAAMDASPEEGAAAAAAVEQSCAAASGYSGVPLHFARLEDVYASDEQRRSPSAQQAGPAAAARRAKLQALLQVRHALASTPRLLA